MPRDKVFGIVVHGGAGSFAPSSRQSIAGIRKTLKRSVETGYFVLKKGGNSIDAVERAITVLEDSKIFNAGAGSSLNLEAKISADASIMKGDLSCGSIAASNVVRNPISLARGVMEKSDHVLIVGNEGTRKFATAIGKRTVELQPTALRLEQYSKNMALMKKGRIDAWSKNQKLVKEYVSLSKEAPMIISDTVGAVAIDKYAKVCAGVSTGGRWLKLPGRVGDSALVGAGLYADDSSGAASATGMGEDIIRVVLCKSVCDFMKMGASAQRACDAAISRVSSFIGTGIAGVIAVDKLGRFGSARNTEMMTRGFQFSSMSKAHIAVLPDEMDPVLNKKEELKRLMF